MINEELRTSIYVAKKEYGVRQYELAEKLGITECKMTRVLQSELTIPQQKKIAQALQELVEEKAIMPLELVKL